jgi:DNA-binding CsgD family transcriptional regulator
VSEGGAVIEEAVRLGDLERALRLADEVLVAGRDDAVVAALGVAYAARGLWSSAASAYESLPDDEHRLLATIARLLTGDRVALGEVDATAPSRRALLLVWEGLAETTGDEPIWRALDRLTEAAQLAAARPDALLPDSVGAVAAAVACELQEADAAGVLVAGAVGPPLLANRHRLLAAWIDVRRGRWADAHAALAAIDLDALDARDAVVAVAVEAAIALRTGDLDRLLEVRERVVRAVTLHPVDLLSLPLFAELLAAAQRLEALGDLGRFDEASSLLLSKLGDPPLWRIAATWSRFRAAAMAGDVEAARELAPRLEGAPVPRLALLHGIAVTWLGVLDGDVDRELVERSAADLESIGLKWESAQLLGAAAVRTDDASVARALLTRARDLRQSLPSLVSGSGEVTLTEREQEIGACVLDGMSHKEIGSHLFISAKTVEHHVARIRTKLGAKSRAELLSLLRRELARSAH